MFEKLGGTSVADAQFSYHPSWKAGRRVLLGAIYKGYAASPLFHYKSFVSLGVGYLEREGKLKLDDPVISYFPEYVTDPIPLWLSQTTIRHMLKMASCHSATTYKKDLSKNWVESFFKIPPDHKPGMVFSYDTSSSHTLCALVEKLTGMEILEYLRKSFLNDIGFSQEAYILKDPFGTSMGEAV